jgi:pentatricopeptide repeat protein
MEYINHDYQHEYLFTKELKSYLQNHQFSEAKKYFDEMKQNEKTTKDILNILKFEVFDYFANVSFDKDIVLWMLKNTPEIVPKVAFNNACIENNINLANVFVEFDANKYRFETEIVITINKAYIDNMPLILQKKEYPYIWDNCNDW